MQTVRRLWDQEIMIRRNGEGSPNGQVVPFEVGGGDSFKPDLRTNAGGPYRVDKGKRRKWDL